MKKIIIQFFTVFVMLNAAVLSVQALETTQPKAIALLFYSKACGSCKILDPKIEAAKKELVTKPILFVKLDHSSQGSTNQAAMLADAIGLKALYASQKKASGYMLLVNRETNELIAKLTREMSVQEIKSTFLKALQG